MAALPMVNDDTGSTDLSSSLSSDEADNGIIGKVYRKLEDLGVGGYSRVILASNIKTDQLVAIKVLLSEPEKTINKDTNKIEKIDWVISDSKLRQCKRECTLMQQIQHENVVKLIDLIEDATFPGHDESLNRIVDTPCLCVVLEYCSRGELFDYLMYAGGLGSRVTRTYFHQFLNGLSAMHSAGYVHRDLKPENLLLDDNYNLKIADFGFATPFKDQNGKIQLTTTCGTRGYLAPELIKGQKYTNKVDLFAVGIIMFTTFAGFPPFQHAGRGDWWWDKMDKAWAYWQTATAIEESSDANKRKKAEKIQKGNQKMKLFWSAHERSCKFSDTFKHLMQYLLNPNPNLRYDIKDCYEHPWLKGKTLSQRQLRRTMRKLNDKVTKQRAIKIRDQLKSRNMQPQGGGNAANNKTGLKLAKRSSEVETKHTKIADECELILKNQTKTQIHQNTAILNKSRFQIVSKRSLSDILATIESVTLKHLFKFTFDAKKCEYTISASITRHKNDKELFEKSERISVKCKIIYEKNTLLNELDSEDTKDTEDDNFLTDSDIEEDENENGNSNNNEQKSDETTKMTSMASSMSSASNLSTSDVNVDRYILAFWRVDGSADGYQRIMAELFYDSNMSSLLDFTGLLDDVDNDAKLKKEVLNIPKAPLAFNAVFENEHPHYADNAETDDLPDAQPIPTID